MAKRIVVDLTQLNPKDEIILKLGSRCWAAQEIRTKRSELSFGFTVHNPELTLDANELLGLVYQAAMNKSGKSTSGPVSTNGKVRVTVADHKGLALRTNETLQVGDYILSNDFEVAEIRDVEKESVYHRPYFEKHAFNADGSKSRLLWAGNPILVREKGS